MRQSRYWKVGMTAFLTVAAILLFYDTMFGSRAAVTFTQQLLNAVAPILYGAMIAYLLAPVVDFFDRRLFRVLTEKAGRKGKFCATEARAGSLFITWILISIFTYLLLSVLVPEVYRSVVRLVGNMEIYYNTINDWVKNLLEKSPSLEKWVGEQLDVYYTDLTKLLTTQVLPQAQQLMNVVSGGIASAMIFLKNLLVGIIVSVYLLATKERCIAYCRKLVWGLFSMKSARWIFRGTRKVDDIFSGFVRGKLLDSLIIGVICFICSKILNFPYAPLVSVIVGVTNIIPFFGPFLGAVPSVFLILLDSPIKALYFLIFIIALQQVDGNVIGPKILGDKTGLSSLWVIIAILVGGSFFGVLGMFFGVPVFACLNSLINFIVDTRLRARNLPVEIRAYRDGQPAPNEKKNEEKRGES